MMTSIALPGALRLTRQLAPILSERITSNGRVVTQDQARAVIAEYEAWAVPCGAKEANKIVSTIIACYPQRNVNDPATYVKFLESVVEQYPIEVALAGADHLTRTCKFLPSRADMEEAMQHAMRGPRSLYHSAMMQLREAVKRDGDRPTGERVDPGKALAIIATVKSNLRGTR